MSGALSFLSHGCLHTLYVSSSPTAMCVTIFLDTLYQTHVHTKFVLLMKTTIQYSPVIDSAKLAQLTGFVSSQIWFYTVPVSFVIPENEAQSLPFSFNKCIRNCELYMDFVIVYSEVAQ